MRVFCWLFQTGALVLWLAASAAAQDPIHWEPSLEAAQRVAAHTNRLILIHCWAPWCGPCMRLEHEVFSQAETGRALEANFVLVKLNVDDAPGTARHYGVSRLPSDVVITATGRLVAKLDSPQSATLYVAQLNQVADGHKQLARNAYVQVTSQTLPQNPADAKAASYATGRESATVQSYPEDRYAEYLSRSQRPADQAAPPIDGRQQMPAAGPRQFGTEQAARDQLVRETQAQMQVAAHSGFPPGVAVPPQIAAGPNLPPGSPPLGLEGFCPVRLIEKRQWVMGDRRFGAIHRGRTYLFSGPEEQKRFLASPDAYSPVMSGMDPVAALDQRQAVPGRRQVSAVYQNRVYLFSDEASYDRFKQNPNRYAAEALQAMR